MIIELKRKQLIYCLERIHRLMEAGEISSSIFAINQFRYWRTEIICLKGNNPICSFEIDAFKTEQERAPASNFWLLSTKEVESLLEKIAQQSESALELEIGKNYMAFGDYFLQNVYFRRLNEIINAITQTIDLKEALDAATFFEAASVFDGKKTTYFVTIPNRANAICSGGVVFALPYQADANCTIRPQVLAALKDDCASQIDVLKNSIFCVLQFCHFGQTDVTLRVYCPRLYNFSPALLEKIKKTLNAAKELGLPPEPIHLF